MRSALWITSAAVTAAFLGSVPLAGQYAPEHDLASPRHVLAVEGAQKLSYLPLSTKQGELSTHPSPSPHDVQVLRLNRMAQLNEEIYAFLMKRFESRKATVRMLDRDDYIFRVQVIGLRSEIVTAAKFWEELDPLTVIFFTVPEKNEVRVFIQADAKYAAVGGKAPRGLTHSTASRRIILSRFRTMSVLSRLSLLTR